jgi:hypothetical protein
MEQRHRAVERRLGGRVARSREVDDAELLADRMRMLFLDQPGTGRGARGAHEHEDRHVNRFRRHDPPYHLNPSAFVWN